MQITDRNPFFAFCLCYCFCTLQVAQLLFQDTRCHVSKPSLPVTCCQGRVAVSAGTLSVVRRRKYETQGELHRTTEGHQESRRTHICKKEQELDKKTFSGPLLHVYDQHVKIKQDQGLASFSRTCVTGKHPNWQIHLWYPDLFTDNGNKISHSFSRLVSVLNACLAGFTVVVLLLSSWCLIYLGFFSGFPVFPCVSVPPSVPCFCLSVYSASFGSLPISLY